MSYEKCNNRLYETFTPNFLHYEIKFSLNRNQDIILEKKNEYKDKIEPCRSSYSNSYFSCQLLSHNNSLICFYIAYNSIAVSLFNLENFNKSNNYNYYIPINYIYFVNKIKSFLITNSNKVFICISGYSIEEITVCFNYNIESKNSSNIFIHNYICSNFENVYFKETQDYILMCNYNKKIELIKINENNIVKYEAEYTFVSFNNYDSIYDFSLNYNSSDREYYIISSCKTYKDWNSYYWNIKIKNVFFISTSSTLLQTLPLEISSTDHSENPSSISSMISSTIPIFTSTLPLILSDIPSSLSSSSIPYIIPPSINSSILSSIPFSISSSIIFQNKSAISSTSFEYNNPKNDSQTNSKIIINEEEIEKEFNGGKEELLQNLTDLVNDITIGRKYTIKGEDFTLIIKPTNSSFLESSTHVNFLKCENTLREILNISTSRIITFLQLEIDNNNDKSIINQVEYQAYDDNKTLLNLSLCNDSNIQIFYAIKNYNSMDMISSFKDLGIDIFNISDSFFNDICRPYSDSKNDIVLEDRIKEIFQNYSLCDEGCSYNEINTMYNTISCDCKVKTNLSINESSINLKKFEDMDIDSNFGLIKCYNLVFSLDGKLYNIGFWIFFMLVLAHIPLLLIYFCKGIKSIEKYIINQMMEYGYINKKNKNINEGKEKNKKKDKNNLNFPPKKKDKNKIKKSVKSMENIDINKKIIGNSSINKIKLSEREIFYQINNKDKKKEKKQNIINVNNENNNIGKNKKGKKKKKSTGKLENKILINNVILLKDSKSKNKKEKKKKNIDILPTQEIGRNKNNKEKIFEKENDKFNCSLININLNNIKEYIPKNSYYILNNYSFQEAVEYDMRSVCIIFYIFLLSKQAIFHAFLYRSPLEPFPLRLCLLIYIISSDLALNAIFYLDDKISEKYKYARNLFLFTFNNNLTIILLSTFIGFIFMTLFTNLSNSTNNIRDIFKKEEEIIKKNKKYKVTQKRKKEILEEIHKILKKHKIKVTILVIIEVALMLFFWYYVTAFCHVYSNTQTSWILDSFLSMLSRLFIIIILSLGFAKLYRMAVEANNHCIYKFVLFFYSFA